MTPDVTEQVALIRGRIVHDGTGKSIVGRVHIALQEAPTLDKRKGKREGGVVGKALPDGIFVVSGRPEFLFPGLDSQDYMLRLQIRVESAQFRRGFAEQKLKVSIKKGNTFLSPIELEDIRLLADPVDIRGRVVKASKPDKPIVDAVVDVKSSMGSRSIKTDAEGRYHFKPARLFHVGLEFQHDLDDADISQELRQEFDHNSISLSQKLTVFTEKNDSWWLIIDAESKRTYSVRKEKDKLDVYEEIIVLAKATISCSATGFKPQTRTLSIDFSKLTNEEDFRLVSS